jgi:membrane protein DedA with SNARE-associated domain
MDKRTKNIIILVAALIAAALVLKLIFTFWWTFIIAAVAFGVGYIMGRRGGKEESSS